MKEQFVTYEIALKLRELGFDEPCLAIYRNRFNDFGITLISNGIKIQGNQSITIYHSLNEEMICLAPLWQQVIGWFRKKYDIHIIFLPYNNPIKGINTIMYEYAISTKNNLYEGILDNLFHRLKHEILELKDFSCINLFNTYEEALEQAILKAIELCKKN